MVDSSLEVVGVSLGVEMVVVAAAEVAVAAAEVAVAVAEVAVATVVGSSPAEVGMLLSLPKELLLLWKLLSWRRFHLRGHRSAKKNG